jgi:ABC-type transport system involved in cytochrome c biogenesis ATPase subunit
MSFHRNERCSVCRPRLMLSMPSLTLLSELIDQLKTKMVDTYTGLPEHIQLIVDNANIGGILLARHQPYSCESHETNR